MLPFLSYYSGLRGAVSFALAIRNTGSDQLKIIFSTTLIIVITTVILFGGLTTQMLEWLKIRYLVSLSLSLCVCIYVWVRACVKKRYMELAQRIRNTYYVQSSMG